MKKVGVLNWESIKWKQRVTAKEAVFSDSYHGSIMSAEYAAK